MENSLSQLKSRSIGSIVGACLGDAIGATLEGRRGEPSQMDVAIAMTMPGGGVHRVAPGQVTDDGEMTISLARALGIPHLNPLFLQIAQCNTDYSIEKVAVEYGNWIRSIPFDVGITTGASIGCVLKGEKNQAFKKHLNDVGYAKAMKAAACWEGTSSKANGSLMRCTPTAVYGHKLTDEEVTLSFRTFINTNQIAWMCHQDSSLSHPNETVCDAVSCYCIAIAELLQGGDNVRAFERAKKWAMSFANSETQEWIQDAQNGRLPPFWPQAGFIKIGFIHAFWHLLQKTPYKEAIKQSIMYGGDTDTNACIVGGLVGAAVGIEQIPELFVKTLFTCDTKTGRPRPEFLHPNQIPDLVDKILTNAPTKINIVPDEPIKLK